MDNSIIKIALSPGKFTIIQIFIFIRNPLLQPQILNLREQLWTIKVGINTFNYSLPYAWQEEWSASNMSQCYSLKWNFSQIKYANLHSWTGHGQFRNFMQNWRFLQLWTAIIFIRIKSTYITYRDGNKENIMTKLSI